jgi:hypothetical protein
MAKSKQKRGGLTTGRKTTARSGKSQSAKARAVSQKLRSDRAGRAGQSLGKPSPTTANPARPRIMINRGPGDVGRDVVPSRHRAGHLNAPKRAK